MDQMPKRFIPEDPAGCIDSVRGKVISVYETMIEKLATNNVQLHAEVVVARAERDANADDVMKVDMKYQAALDEVGKLTARNKMLTREREDLEARWNTYKFSLDQMTFARDNLSHLVEELNKECNALKRKLRKKGK
jgi:seryl-tRNA synthetase